jgi:signal transduction histidine kinase
MRNECGDAPDLPERMGSRFKHLRLIHEEIARLDSLIGSSLLSSKLDLQRNLVLFPVEFSALCLEACQRHAALMEKRGFNFEQDIQPGLWVRGDEATLCIVVDNLLDNALKYTEAGGRVRIAVTTDKDDVLLTVENSHMPMPEDWLTGIFAPFCRGNITTENSEGSGFGLYLVEKITALHHGRVFAGNSQQGICLTVSLKLWKKDI